jgi:tRNA dimethylallyltransferase
MSSNVEKYLVVLAGPTAVGKTSLSLSLALRYNTAIVSADSRQLYREMQIGTAKPTPEELASVPHHFIDHLSLDEEYTAGRFQRECSALLAELFQTKDIVLLVGGSGLYLRAAIEGFDEMPEVPLEIRDRWKEVLKEQGIEHLRHELLRLDPVYHAEVDLHNARRLVRALSMIETTGKPFSDFRNQARQDNPFQIIKVFCNLPREELYERIESRVDQMIADGLLEEVQSLQRYRETQAMQTVGYREIIAHLDGACTLEEAIDKIKQHTRNYAKRQLTWFRNQGDWKEFNPPNEEEIALFIHEKRE